MTTCLAPPPDKPKKHKDWQFGIILALDAPRRTYGNLGEPEEDSEVIDRVLGHRRYAGEARLEARRIITEKLRQTEGNEEYYWPYDGDDDSGLHRKFVGVLSREDFEALTGGSSMYADTTPTGGAVGMPTPEGWDLGFSPAIAFDGPDSSDYKLGAYVRPYPPTARRGMGDADWNRIRQAVIRECGA